MFINQFLVGKKWEKYKVFEGVTKKKKEKKSFHLDSVMGGSASDEKNILSYDCYFIVFHLLLFGEIMFSVNIDSE